MNMHKETAQLKVIKHISLEEKLHKLANIPNYMFRDRVHGSEI